MGDWRKPCSASWQKPCLQGGDAQQMQNSNSDAWRFRHGVSTGSRGGLHHDRIASDWRLPAGNVPGAPGVIKRNRSKSRSRSPRRRVRAVDLDPFAVTSHPNQISDDKLTKYAQNGRCKKRIKMLLSVGQCECTRQCFQQVKAATLERVCEFYWRLPPEEQAFLARARDHHLFMFFCQHTWKLFVWHVFDFRGAELNCVVEVAVSTCMQLTFLLN